MKRRTLIRRGLYVVGLTLVWLMLWDTFSVANAASGVLVACLVLIVFPTKEREERTAPHATVIRPFAVLRLVLYVAGQLVVSNALVAREIVARRSRIRTGIVACRLQTSTPGMITLIANLIEISPGTMTVEVRAEPPTIYVHMLMLRELLEARASVAHLERLVLDAFGTDADRLDAGPHEAAP